MSVVVILTSLGLVPVSARTHEYSAVKCQLVAPDGWKTSYDNRRPGDVVFFSADGRDNDRRFDLYVQHADADSTAPLNADSACVKKVIAQSKDGHTQILEQDTQTVNGITYYVLLMRQQIGSSRYNSAECWLTVKDGNVYQLWIAKKNSDVVQDSDLSAIVDSFSFTAK